MSKIFQEAFCETIERFGLKIVWLSKESGINDGTITRFKTGKRDIYLESFGKIFDAMPIEAKHYFLEKLLGDAIAPSVTPSLVISKLDPDNPLHQSQVADAMRLIATRFFSSSPGRDTENTRESTDETRELSLLK
jgi:hypothetical protein